MLRISFCQPTAEACRKGIDLYLALLASSIQAAPENIKQNSLLKAHPGATVVGSVKIQESTISRATPQRTLENLRATPAPTVDEVIICVVETGMPKTEANCNPQAAEVSAAKPCSGAKGASFMPKVLIIRNPHTPRQVQQPIQ